MADHGFAGAAIERGFEVIGFNDVNDPALAVAKARRKIEVLVPLDDNVPSAPFTSRSARCSSGRYGTNGTTSLSP